MSPLVHHGPISPSRVLELGGSLLWWLSKVLPGVSGLGSPRSPTQVDSFAERFCRGLYYYVGPAATINRRGMSPTTERDRFVR